MKLSTYILFIAIAITQWLVMQLPWVHPVFDVTTFLLGNLQMLFVLFGYDHLNKYINK